MRVWDGVLSISRCHAQEARMQSPDMELIVWDGSETTTEGEGSWTT